MALSVSSFPKFKHKSIPPRSTIKVTDVTLRWISLLIVICEYIVQIAWIFCVFLFFKMWLHLFQKSMNLLVKSLCHMIIWDLLYALDKTIAHSCVFSSLLFWACVLGLIPSLLQELCSALSHSPWPKELSAQCIFIPGWHSANRLWKPTNYELQICHIVLISDSANSCNFADCKCLRKWQPKEQECKSCIDYFKNSVTSLYISQNTSMCLRACILLNISITLLKITWSHILSS